MFTRWNNGWTDFDETLSTMNQLRTYMDRVFDDALGSRLLHSRYSPLQAAGWPHANIVDAGSSLVLTAEVPGLGEKDITLTLNPEILTIEGERKVPAPEGYSAHRQERPAVRFSRSFTLPSKVDADRASASVKNGILTVTLEKATEAMPRQIAVAATN